MFKRIIAFILVTIIAFSTPICVFAEENLITRKLLKVVKIAETGDYVYYPQYYSEEAHLMPVAKNSFARYSFMMEPMGYADKDGNIKISFHNNWSYAGKFINGIAVIYDKNKKRYSAINTKGEVIFDFDDDTALDGVGDSFYFQIFENEPNGMYCASVISNGNSITKSNNPTLTIYDKKGNKIKKKLPYYRIGMFHNGVANLYNLEKEEITGYFGEIPLYKYEYKAVASINTKGEIFNYPVEEYTEPTSYNAYGFSVENVNKFEKIIKNSNGKEIYRYTTEGYFDDHYFINENAVLVPVEQKDGTTAYTLMDYNGNLYHEYQFTNNFDGSYGNRFIVRPYKSYDEKVAYAKKLGAEGEDWLHRTTYMAEGKNLIIYDLQPYTIFEIQEIGESAIPNSAKITVNGIEYTAPAYNIRGENFLRIRDIAYMLNGTSKQFSVIYNSSLNSIMLKSGSTYEMTGVEMKALSTGQKEAKYSKQKMFLNETEITPVIFQIDGSNFVRLRDLGQIIDFQIHWEDTTKTVVINTESGYN